MQAIPETALLRSFLVVAQELSFRRAADRLALDQSALSRRIQKLEVELGYALFERSTREVTMTTAGVSLYRGISRNLDDCMRSIDEARRAAAGLLGQAPHAQLLLDAQGKPLEDVADRLTRQRDNRPITLQE